MESPSHLFLIRPSFELRRDLLIGSIKNLNNSYKVVASAVSRKPELLKIMTFGDLSSGEGSQCELITGKYDLVHIASGDLLRAETAAGTNNGKRAKNEMEKGQLMVKDRLMCPDSQEKGWLFGWI